MIDTNAISNTLEISAQQLAERGDRLDALDIQTGKATDTLIKRLCKGVHMTVIIT